MRVYFLGLMIIIFSNCWQVHQRLLIIVFFNKNLSSLHVVMHLC